MVAGLDLDEDREVQPELQGVDKRDTPLDDAAFLQLLDPSPARRLREIHAGRDVCDRYRGVLLQDRQYLAVGRVHQNYSHHWKIILRRGCCSARSMLCRADALNQSEMLHTWRSPAACRGQSAHAFRNGCSRRLFQG